jgi:signal transduction histidine kinase
VSSPTPADELDEAPARAQAHLELRLENDRLRELDRTRDEFVALVSHDLRTPLSSILGYLEELQTDELGPLTETQRRFLGVIERNAQRLLGLVGDLLFLTQAETARASLATEQLDLAQLVADAVAAAEPAAADNGVELSVEADAGVPVTGDPGRLTQMASNLVSSAVKSTPQHGRVVVAVASRDGDAVLEVAGTGISFPDAGLEVAIARAIVAAHRGAIDVESTVEAGTTVRVRLPEAAPGE